MKIKGLVIKNPRNWKSADYTGEFDDTGMRTTIPKDILDKLDLKQGDSVRFEYKGTHVHTNLGKDGLIGLTRPEVKKLGHVK